MKTLMTACIFIFILSFNSFADEKAIDTNSWDFFGIVLFPGVPTSSNDCNIAGIRAGLPISGGQNEVRGIEFAAIGCMTESLYGIQTAPIFCTGKVIRGLQASPVNIADKVRGLQFGIFNASKDASFQIGILNYNKSSIIPFLPVINFSF